MKVKWVFEDILIDAVETNRIKKSAENIGCEIGTINTYQWFLEQNSALPFPNNDQQCIVYYGSLQLGKLIKQKTNWVPGIWLNYNSFKCSTYYNYFYNFLFNIPFSFLTFGTLKEEQIFKNENEVFIRPDSGFKTFTGNIFKKETFKTELEKIKNCYDVQPEEIVLLSSVKNIKKEWRVFVVENSIVTGSEYISDKKTSINKLPDNVIKYTQNVLNLVQWKPEPAFSIDICEDYSEKLYVLEINSFNCSGIYGANTDILVEEINKLAIKDFESYHSL